MNKSSCDRGFGRCIVFRKTVDSVRKYSQTGLHDIIIKPDIEPGKENDKKFKRFRNLDKDGLCAVAGKMQPGDVLLSKKVPKDVNVDPASVPGGAVQSLCVTPRLSSFFVAYALDRYVEQNKTFKGAVEAVVDKIMLSNNPDDQTIVKILMRETRRPELGDKFSSRSVHVGSSLLVFCDTYTSGDTGTDKKV
jgi:DNA-directed RNA polymerase III subunit RPC2